MKGVYTDAALRDLDEHFHLAERALSPDTGTASNGDCGSSSRTSRAGRTVRHSTPATHIAPLTLTNFLPAAHGGVVEILHIRAPREAGAVGQTNVKQRGKRAG